MYVHVFFVWRTDMFFFFCMERNYVILYGAQLYFFVWSAMMYFLYGAHLCIFFNILRVISDNVLSS